MKILTRATGLGLSVWLAAMGPVFAAEPWPLPAHLPADNFQDVLVRATDSLYIAGQPSITGLEQMRDAGVTTVINLRTHREMDDRGVVPFDEAGKAAELGLAYIHIPSGGPDTPYSPEMVARFAEALEQAEGRVLLHCTVAWRASHLYAAYLHRYQGLTIAQAVAQGRAINLGTLPLEGFLGAPLEIRVAE
jgi:uncharacterized protein (TIGR01244 family)